MTDYEAIRSENTKCYRNKQFPILYLRISNRKKRVYRHFFFPLVAEKKLVYGYNINSTNYLVSELIRVRFMINVVCEGKDSIPDTAHTWSEDQSSAPLQAQIDEASTVILG